MSNDMNGFPSLKSMILPALLVAATGLSGCAAPLRPGGNYNSAEYNIGTSRAQQGLYFEPGSAALARGEKARLDAVMRSLELRAGDDIVVYVPGSGSEVLDERRVEQARVAVEGHGARIRVVRNAVPGDLDPGPDAAVVHVFRYNRFNVVCPRQGVDFADDRNGTREILIGCTNAANRAAMAHERADLIDPGELGGSSVTTDLKAVDAYRDWAERVTTIEIAGGE